MSEVDLRSKLEGALAINRTIEYLEQHKWKEASTIEQAQTAAHATFVAIHRALYRDSHGHPQDENPAGYMEPADSNRLRGALNSLMEALYDGNGFEKSLGVDEFATNIGKAYRDVLDIAPFKEGVGLTFRTMLLSIARSDGFRETSLGKLDFRKLSQETIQNISGETATAEDLAALIKEAMTGEIEVAKVGGDKAERWQEWENKSVEIKNFKFIGVTEGDKEFVLTTNGGMVPRALVEERLEKVKEEGALLGEIKFTPSEIEGYVDETISKKKFIDGIEASQGLPLISMDLDILSGLTHPRHAELVEFLDDIRLSSNVVQRLELEDDRVNLFSLANPEIAKTVYQEATAEMRRYIRIAEERLQGEEGLVAKMDAAVAKCLEGKKPDRIAPTKEKPQGARPYFIMMMGGGGSGKGSLDALIEEEMGSNFVTPSLDEARGESDIYDVLTSVGHHSDDYKAVESMAQTIRKWTMEKAIEDGYSIRYDGSGINYGGRYDKIIETVRDQGYDHRSICAVDCSLVIPDSREQEFGDPAQTRVLARASEGDDQRALPHRVVLDKHIAFPKSFMEALEDPLLDEIILGDNAGPWKSHYVLARTYDLVRPSVIVDEIKNAMKDGTLKSTLERNQLWPDKSLDGVELEGGGAAKDLVTEEDISVLVTRVGKVDRLLVVTNTARFVDFIQKGQLNRRAAGDEDLTLMSDKLASVVYSVDMGFDPKDYKKGRISKLQADDLPADYSERIKQQQQVRASKKPEL